MNSLVAPLSTRQVMDFHSEVSIVLISTFSLRDVRPCLLVVGSGFQGVNCSCIGVSRTKVLSEFHSKFVPVKELGISSIFFFPPENSSHPFGHPSGFHVRQGPGDFYLVRMKGVGTKVHICLDRIKKGLSSGPFSIKLCW